MVNYENSTIYKLCCKDPTIKDEYVGSTVNFTRRKACHKSHCLNENYKEYNFKVYQCIRDNGGWDNWAMIEVERYCASDKKDLHARERFWLEELGATLNKNVPNRSISEWYQINKEKKAEYNAEYRQKNKVKIAEYKYEYYQKNKEKIAEKQSEYHQNNKEKIAEYGAEYRQKNKEKITEKQAKKYQKNKEKIAEYSAKIYKKNKEKIAEKNAEKVECECGCVISKGNLLRHSKSAKHKRLIEQKED